MTITTPMEGLTAPMRAADPHAATAAATQVIDHDDNFHSLDDDTPVEDFAREAAGEGRIFTPSRRADGWTPERQRGFLDYIAQGLTVSDAAALVGLSAASAYAFRARAAGAAFAIGWQGALLLQRNRLVDDLTSRAFRGQTETVTRPDGSIVERHRHDNRLALALLTRLDKIAAADLPDRTGDARAARLAAQDWDRYLDLIAAEASPAQAGMFLALRVTEGEAQGLEPIAALARADLYRRTGAGLAAEVDVRDLDPAQRGSWTAEQWTRAEAAGLVALAPAPAPAPDAAEAPRGSSQLSQHSREDDEGADDPVWWCSYSDGWRTRFPPPADFFGNEDGEYGDEDYARDLTDEEVEAWDAPLKRDTERRRPIEEATRDAFFAALMLGEEEEEEEEVTAPDATHPPSPVRAERVEARTPDTHFDRLSANGSGEYATPRPFVPSAVAAPSLTSPQHAS